MIKRIAVMSVAAVLLCGSALAASYSTGTVYSTVLQGATSHACSDFVYDPEIYSIASNNLQVLAQGANTTLSRDSILGFTRTASSGAWSSASTIMTGGYARCTYSPTGTKGPIGSPSVVKVGSKYYMAYVGGNADQITGKVYWAVSNDGQSWTSYNVSPPTGEILTPIIYPYYHEECNTTGLASGAGQVHLAFVDNATGNDYFYFYIRYGHWYNNAYQGVDTLAFRISYNSSSTWGLGSTKQIWQNGWVNNTGQLKWSYDCIPDANGNVPYWCGTSEELLTGTGWNSNMTFYPGDMKFDTTLNKWVHFYQESGVNAITWETLTDLSQPGSWASGGTVDITTIKNVYGTGIEIYYPGVYFGPLCSGCASGRYIFVPIDNTTPTNCSAPFEGTRLIIAELTLTTP